LSGLTLTLVLFCSLSCFRDTLFCFHKASEAFLQRLVSLYVASHYKVGIILIIFSDSCNDYNFVMFHRLEAQIILHKHSTPKTTVWHLEVFTPTLLMRSAPFNIQNKDKQENTCMNIGNAVFTVT